MDWRKRKRRRRGSCLESGGMKLCCSCERRLPATPENFQRSSREADGWAIQCKVCRQAVMRKYRQKHKPWTKPDAKERLKAWREANRERVSRMAVASATAWAKANREARKRHSVAHTSKRRAMKLLAPGFFTGADIAELFVEQDGLCCYCNADISDGRHSVDHRVPLSKGGGNGRDNIALACVPCNSRKNAMLPDEWERRRKAA
jgi:5-methylcytosine-specific restriction endonuclease McrA